MKQALSTVLAILIMLAVIPFSVRSASTPESLGDVNRDGEINSTDATYVLQYFARIITDFSDIAAKEPDDDKTSEEITLWTYPIGSWGDEAAVDKIISDFNAVYPNITVNVKLLNYMDGDAQVSAAIESGNTPDIIMEGPERLVADWGAKGLMADLSDLWTDELETDVYANVKAACSSDGALYEYPLCMTVHTMAINYDMFKAAGALQYINEDTHTWKSTEDFFKAVQAVYDNGQTNVGTVFCGGQGGDQGTRALINNLYGGTYTNAEHTAYTVDSEENIRAIRALCNQDGINFDASLTGGEEASLFCEGKLAMSFCWNIAQDEMNADNVDFEIFPMAFPSDSEPALQGGVWGCGIFDNGDEDRIQTAKTFIDWVSNENTENSVKASTYWSVKKSQSDLYADDELMTEYGMFVPYFGDYYQVTPGWNVSRAAWWNMLRQISEGLDVEQAVSAFSAVSNAAAGD